MANVFFTFKKIFKDYANGGNMLMLATVLALLVVNLPFSTEFYNSLWTHEMALQIGDFNLFSHHGEPMSVMAFINDALMAVFFFSVGLEIKREVLVGELHSVRKALLPIIGACGGMIVPVTVFYLLAKGTDYVNGCAIPMATDIAFSLGVLAMLGNRVPIGLKVFLTTQSKMFYLMLGAVVWFLFLNAGIHPTIAGVLIAFTIPAKPVYAPKKYIQTIRTNIGYFDEENDETLNSRTILSDEQLDHLKEIESASDKVISPLQDMEDSLHPVVNYIIVPLFAFANAGIFLGDMDISMAFSGVSLATMSGLVVGKFVGIFIFAFLAIKLGLAPMPKGGNWARMASISMLGGIGFTVSLFIANLSFGTGDPALSLMLNESKLGILIGSLVAGILGWLMLHLTLPKAPQPQEDA